MKVKETGEKVFKYIERYLELSESYLNIKYSSKKDQEKLDGAKEIRSDLTKLLDEVLNTIINGSKDKKIITHLLQVIKARIKNLDYQIGVFQNYLRNKQKK
jgi:hypothetical protein